MEITASQDPQSESPQTIAAAKPIPRPIHLAALGGVMLLAAALRLVNLESLGLANHYYAAAVKSMLISWHNFFFVAAEPGGSVSVDKPPVGLWLQAISARIFGITTLGLLLPQIIAGLLSVLLIYHLVKRRFGPYAGLLAALVLAITPVVVATDRNNTMDSTLIFTLLLAAWAFIKATETSRLKFLLVGAILVGIAFNIKMLEAYLPLPAFLGMYFLGAKESLLRKIGKLGMTSLIIIIISLSWAIAVDLTPADRRPYIGSSGDNSELSLIIGYNGLQRLEGMLGRPGGINGSGRVNQGNIPPNQDITRPPNNSPINPGAPSTGISPRTVPNPFPNAFPANGNRNIGVSSTGQAGPLRLFIPPLSKEASWLLPLALFCIFLLILSSRLTWPISSQHQAVVLWGGWLVTAGIFFSVAGFFHEYYLSTLAPPLAALVGIGVITTWLLGKHRPWLVAVSFTGITILTLLLQYNTAKAFVSSMPWLPLVIALLGIGTIALLAGTLIRLPIRMTFPILGIASLVAAMLTTPAVWSALTNRYAAENQSLPAAYSGETTRAINSQSLSVDEELLNFLQTNTQGIEYLMAVPSSMQGADYILATGRPVLYMGGFMGQDEVLTPESLSKLIKDGKLRYIYWNTQGGSRPGGGAFGGQSLITSWVSANCQVVQGFNTPTSNFGAPDGISGGSAYTIGSSLGAAQQIVLYDCAR